MLLLYAAAVYLVPPWDRKNMTSGVFLYTRMNEGQSPAQTLRERALSTQMLFYRDGRDGTVSVLENEDQRMLVINGKIDASSVYDLPTQSMLAHLPVMMHPQPRRVLIIGLGSGITAGVVALHPGVESIDILEISPEVVAASEYFSEANRRVLDDPRVNLIVADARNFTLGTQNLYDIIISEPSNPWISGISNLFTLDFFRLLNSRLADGGIVCQWMHIYNMGRDDVRSVLNSFRTPFPFVSVWLSQNSDLIMIGSSQSHGLEGERFNRTLSHPEVREDLGRIGRTSLGKIATMFLCDQQYLDEYCRDAPFNTDDRPRVEFNAPQNLYQLTTEEVLRDLFYNREVLFVTPPITNVALVIDRSIHAFTVDITVKTHEPPPPGSWRAGYQAWSKLYRSGEGGVDMLGVGSQMQLEWRDGETENLLAAFHVVNMMTTEQLKAYLLVDGQNILLAGGEIDLPGGARGVWHVCRSGDHPSRVIYSITWIVPASPLYGGYYHYIAERNQPDPGQERWGEFLVQLAQSFLPAARADR